MFESEGRTDRSLRRAVGGNAGVPADLASYVDKLARHAYEVTDADVSALKARYDEDALFEITVSAAVGAGLARLEAGLAALRAARGKAAE